MPYYVQGKLDLTELQPDIKRASCIEPDFAVAISGATWGFISSFLAHLKASKEVFKTSDGSMAERNTQSKLWGRQKWSADKSACFLSKWPKQAQNGQNWPKMASRSVSDGQNVMESS